MTITSYPMGASNGWASSYELIIIEDTSTDFVLKAAQVGYYIKVWRYDLFVRSAATLLFMSNVINPISGTKTFGDSANNNYVKDFPFIPVPWHRTALSEALGINLSASVLLSGEVVISVESKL
jgi:hypothetical protein